jgi:hypothetical protein
MYLITIQQQIVGKLSPNVPTRRQRAANLKELADWCHVFIRSCRMMGWNRTDENPDGSIRLSLVDFRSDFYDAGICKFMVLRRADVQKAITIEIDEIPDQPAAVVAEQVAR